MKHLFRTTVIFTFCTIFSAFTLAADDHDININGDFRNASLKSIPGWQISGQYSLIPRRDRGKYAVKLTANAKLTSDLYPVYGEIVKLKADISGTGGGTFSVICFDKNKKRLEQCVSRTFTVSNRKREFKRNFALPSNASFAAIELQTAANSAITVSDIDAEFKKLHAATSATAKYTPTVKEQTKQNLPAAPARPLINDRFYALNEISLHPYQLTLSRGDDFEFELRESDGKIWTLARCDGNICRVKIKHDRDGIWPFRYDKAEVEIEALRAGKTTIILNHPDKQMIIDLDVQ